jgi:hypothetical protein
MKLTIAAAMLGALALSVQGQQRATVAGQQVASRGRGKHAGELATVEDSREGRLQNLVAGKLGGYARRGLGEEVQLAIEDEETEDESGDDELEYDSEDDEVDDAVEDEELEEDESEAEEPVDFAGRALRGLTPAMSTQEDRNARYIQTFRKREGCPTKLSYSNDLVKEAQRWSRRMARLGHVANRDPLSVNVDAGWITIAEIPGKYNNVTYSGAMAHLEKANRAYLLDSCFNRVGVGIKKASSGAYFMTILLKQV